MLNTYEHFSVKKNQIIGALQKWQLLSKLIGYHGNPGVGPKSPAVKNCNTQTIFNTYETFGSESFYKCFSLSLFVLSTDLF